MQRDRTACACASVTTEQVPPRTGGCGVPAGVAPLNRQSVSQHFNPHSSAGCQPDAQQLPRANPARTKGTRPSQLFSNGPDDWKVLPPPLKQDDIHQPDGDIRVKLLVSQNEESKVDGARLFRQWLQFTGVRGPWVIQQITTRSLGSAICDGSYEHECQIETLEAFRVFTLDAGGNEVPARQGEIGFTTRQPVAGLDGEVGNVDVHFAPVP